MGAQLNKLLRTFAAACFCTVAFAHVAAAQPQPNAPLDTIIKRAAEQRNAYINEFKNLLSQEERTFAVYGKDGKNKKHRKVISIFIVYQSPENGVIAEFRNVVSVDGKPVANADKRAQNFFEEVLRAAGTTREWDRIEKEGSRFDQGISINGMTLFQAVVLADNIRPAFEFQLTGSGTIDGRPTHIVSYRQIRDSRYISMDPARMAADGEPELVYDLHLDKGAVARVHGNLWIDADTFQLRKEQRIVTVVEKPGSRSAFAVETTLEYRDSLFGILTPKRLLFTQFRLGKNGAESRREIEVAFNYSDFTKPDVEVKAADVKEQ